MEEDGTYGTEPNLISRPEIAAFFAEVEAKKCAQAERRKRKSPSSSFSHEERPRSEGKICMKNITFRYFC